MNYHSSFRFNQRACFTARLLFLFLTLLASAFAGESAAQAQGNTYVVTSTADTAQDGCTAADVGDGCTLREAINAVSTLGTDPANAHQINFAPGVTGVIELTQALATIQSKLTITGPGADLLTIRRKSHSGKFRIFTVTGRNIASGSKEHLALSGLTLSGGDPTTGNFPGEDGGAISLNGGDLTVTDCIIENNKGVGGGAIATRSGQITIINSTIRGNTASGGGGIANFTGNLTILNSTLNNNQANFGGAVGNYGISYDGTSRCIITNSTIANNTATDGGAIGNSGWLQITHSTLSGNQAFAKGINIFNKTEGTSASTLRFGYCILGTPPGNGTTNDISNIANNGGIVTSLGYNLCMDGGNGFLNQTGDLINTDPGFLSSELFDNGGPTPTLRLSDYSPAINAGDPNFDPAQPAPDSPPLPYDQRGAAFPRVQAGRIDIGAVESAVLPVVIEPPSVMEGTSQGVATATTKMIFAVTLRHIGNEPISINYTTQDDSAGAPSDYAATSGALTFTPGGPLTQTVEVAIRADNFAETDESLRINLSTALGVRLLTSGMYGLILNDDDGVVPSISINDVAVAESNSGTTQAQFTATLSAPSKQTVTVVANANTYTETGNPRATPGADYISLTDVIITFAPGQTTRTISVSVLGDLADEGDEKFSLSLSYAKNAAISDRIGTATILDNDPPPTISASAPNLTEGDADSNTMTFTLRLSAPSYKIITVSVRTVDATTSRATAGIDYVAVPFTTVTFMPGETTKTFPVTVTGDLLDELNERIALQMSNVANATIGTVTDGVIVDNDAPPTLSINDQSINEGHSGTKTLLFTITLSAPSSHTVTVNVSTASGGNPAATPGTDYVALPPTTLTFAPGQTSKQVSVTINGDTVLEANEKFGVILSGAVNATIADNSGIATIINDDSTGLAAPLPAPSTANDASR